MGELGLCAKHRCGPAVTRRLLGLQPSLGLAVLPALETLLAGTRACFWDGRWACANVAVGGHPGSPVPALSRLLLLAAWRCLALLLLRASAAKFRTTRAFASCAGEGIPTSILYHQQSGWGGTGRDALKYSIEI